MKLKTKIGLGITSVVIASLPFFYKEKPKNEMTGIEPIDIVVRDVCESQHVSAQDKDYVKGENLTKFYELPDGRVFKVRACEVCPDFLKDREKYIDDKTPDTFYGNRIVGCTVSGVIDEKLSSKDIDDLVKQAKTDTLYRTTENRIIRQVSDNPSEIDVNAQPIWNVPILRDLFKIIQYIAKSRTYILDDGTEIKAVVFYSKYKEPELTYYINRCNFLRYDSASLRSQTLERRREEFGNFDYEARFISGKRLEQIIKLID